MLLFTFALAGALAQEPVDPVLYPPEVAPEDEVGTGELRVEGGGALVLEHTSMVAEVHAGMARVTLIQWFHNPYEEPIEATYLLPLPSMAAVDTMDLTCGDRRIEGIVLPRQEARDLYEQAKADGKKAALLEQQRDNLFTQKVAGICPGETVEVTIQYVETVPYDDGTYSLALPTTVGPRFAPPWDVPDHDLIDTEYERTGHDVDITVYVDEGLPLESVWSDSHDVDIEDADWGGQITLTQGDVIPNRDFTLSWTLAGNEPRAALLAYRPDEDDGYLALTVEPPILSDTFEQRPRELLFVLDASCSMGGQPWELASQTVLHALDRLGPNDTFDVVTFSNGDSALFETPQPATKANKAAAKEWLAEAYDGGGTQMERGILRSLGMPETDRLRLVLFLTDGYIGDEAEMFRLVREHRGKARLFSLGIGEAPNRYLLEGLAEMGKGQVSYQSAGRPIAETVGEFYERIAHPAMTDIRIDWGGLEVVETYPKSIPDLWVGQPIRVIARYRGAGEATVRLTGVVGRETWEQELTVELPERSLEHEALGSLWARRKIRDLEWYPGKLTSEQVEDAIVDVAMEHHLVSKYTSLVAVDDRPSRCGPASFSLEIPHELPAGTQSGSGGLGGKGYGMGGGGSAYGVGGLGVKGIGYGASGYGTGGGRFAAKVQSDPVAVAGSDAVVLGSIDRSYIDQVVKRHLNQIRYCYEKELQKDPTLAGKVVIKFVIAADGTVAAASVKESTLGNEVVEQCVAGRFLRMQFPVPAGGSSTVVVSYPFQFAPDAESVKKPAGGLRLR